MKQIKFCLRIPENNGTVLIYNIEEMRKHFNLDIIYNYFQKGILTRWLEVHNYLKEVEELKKMSEQEPIEEQLKKITKIFFKDFSDQTLYDEIEKTITLQNQVITDTDKRDTRKKTKLEEIKNYFEDYSKLVQELIDSQKNMPRIKEKVHILLSDFFLIYDIDKVRLLKELKNEAPIALLYILANEKARKDEHLIPYKEYVIDCFNNISDVFNSNNGVENISEKLDSSLEFSSYLLATPEYKSTIKTCNKSTAGMWDDIQRPNSKYMILHATPKTVRSYHKQGAELEYNDLLELPIVDGIEYRSSDTSNVVIYMEL